MKKLHVSTREIGSVKVFDLIGAPTQESLEEVAWTIQRKIRRHRLQRVILNLQMLPSLEPIGVRKLLAACIRPQKSLIFGASASVADFLHNTYMPRNVRLCASEKEVAEDFGPFLMEKERSKMVAKPNGDGALEDSIAYQVERRRSKRMHVALPIELTINLPGAETLVSQAIATNISEGGLFAEYLDLHAAQKIEEIAEPKGLIVEARIFASVNFPEEFKMQGTLNRKELRRHQLGIALEFQS